MRPGMRAREKTKERREDGNDVGLSISSDESKERRQNKALDKALFAFHRIGIAAGILVFIGVSAHIWSGTKELAGKATAHDSDEAIMRRATAEVNRWVKTGELPTFGVTRGDYSYNSKFCHFCGGGVEWCIAHNITNTTTPPVELLIPGRLVSRIISEKAICFLWYADLIYSRPSGGKNGIWVQRVGGVDSKNGLLAAFKKYEEEFKCQPFKAYPVSLDLSMEENCEAFRTGYFADSSELKDIIWFVKASNGSTGNHIQLVRGDVAAKAGSVTAKCTGDCRLKVECPAPDLIASMNVRNIWIVDGKKFDNRAYLLIASVDPLVVFYRMGHLRFSILDYKGSSDLDFNVHVTNPRFAHNLTNDTNKFIRPFDSLRDEMVRMHGESEGTHRFARLKQSVMNAMLYVVYSVKSVWEQREMWEQDSRRKKNVTWADIKGSGYALRWSYAFLALDIAMDTNGNAFVLDVNTGPSFYHKMDLEAWFRRERSIMAREAFDIMQEVAFKKVFSRSHNTTDWDVLKTLKTPSHWLPLYSQPSGGAATGPLGETLLQHGQCPKLYT